MTKKIFTIISLFMLIFVFESIRLNNKPSAYLAVQNSASLSQNNEQPIVPKTGQANKNSKKIIAPQLKAGIDTSISYYPERRLTVKTTNNLLTTSAVLITIGLSLIELDGLANHIKDFSGKGNFSKSFFRLINRIL